MPIIQQSESGHVYINNILGFRLSFRPSSTGSLNDVIMHTNSNNTRGEIVDDEYDDDLKDEDVENVVDWLEEDMLDTPNEKTEEKGIMEETGDY